MEPKNILTKIEEHTHRVPSLLKALVLVLGAGHTWVAILRFSMNEDGISYLDIADAYMTGDWNTAINSVWSPLYSWMLGPVLHLVKPSMEWEFGLVQIVNFVIFVFALLAFETLWRQVIRYQKDSSGDADAAQNLVLPEWIMWSLGYLLFGFSSLGLINIWSVTPDMLMSIFVYLVGAEVIRARIGSWTWPGAARTGLFLGCGYLAKAVMFPLAFAVMVIGVFADTHYRRALPRMGLALVCFLLVSAPFVTLISVKKGGFTFGDAGTLTFARYINGVVYPHWQGDPPESGRPVHPTRVVHDDPPIYEFATPVGGTYPVATDPSYWYEGVVSRPDLRKQAAYVLYSIAYYLELLAWQQGGVLFGVLLLFLLSGRPRGSLSAIGARWSVALIGLAGLAGYSLIHVIGRYIGAFLILLWADALGNIRINAGTVKREFVTVAGSVMIAFMFVSVLIFNLQDVLRVADADRPHEQVSDGPAPQRWPGEVAAELHRLGVGPGKVVGVIGDGFDSFWARLAKVKIVAEMPGRDAGSFWRGDAELKRRVLDTFREIGVHAIVGEYLPADADTEGWHRVGNSDFFIYIFESQ